MDQKEFKKIFDEKNKVNYETVLKIQDAYNSLNLSTIVGAKDEKAAVSQTIDEIKNQVPEANLKDFNYFFSIVNSEK